MYLAVADTKYFRGLEAFSSGRYPFSVLPWKDVLRAKYDTDSHFVTYLCAKDNRIPTTQMRITKPQHAIVQSWGNHLIHGVCAVDIDTPTHTTLTKEHLSHLRDVLPEVLLSWSGFYTTRHGVRLLRALSRYLSPYEFEWYVKNIAVVDALKHFSKPLWAVDLKCGDWTRDFRCPDVARQGDKRNKPRDKFVLSFSEYVAPVPFIPAERPKIVRSVAVPQLANLGSLLDAAKAEVAQLPLSVCGNRQCHDFLWAVCLMLTRGYGISVEDAFPVAMAWAQRVNHGWTEEEVHHKLQNSSENSTLELYFARNARQILGIQRMPEWLEGDV